MSTTEGGQTPAGDQVPTSDEVVITTVVSADDARSPAPDAPAGDATPAPASDDDLAWAWHDAVTAPSDPEQARRLAVIEERLAALEGVPGGLESLGKATRHELERCANVLFGHDRALGALADRLEALEAPAARAADGVAPKTTVSEEALARMADQIDRLGRRVAAMESRVEPLEPLPTLVQALRRAVRASDELISGETAAREQALAALTSELATEAQARDEAVRRQVSQDLERIGGIAAAQAKALTDVAERLATAEARLTPLDTVPDDIAALSRIVRRELDAVVSDNQARDQMLRRALQNELDQLRASSENREALVTELSGRLDALESRSTEAALAHAQTLGAATGRLEAVEARLEALAGIGSELQEARDSLGKELEQVRAGAQAHDQLAGELTRRMSALDGRLARLDAVPGEVQSLRTALLQEAERAVTSLRAIEERIGQLSWVPGEFQEARKRIIALTSGLQAGQDRLRQLEGALASTNERLEALRARLSASPPPAPHG